LNLSLPPVPAALFLGLIFESEDEGYMFFEMLPSLSEIHGGITQKASL
jgi:hypothetical protein